MVPENEKGQITVFLSLILMAVVILAGVLIDAARIYSGETQVRRAMASSARSVLANYSTKLKEDYGLFMLGENESGVLESRVRDYMSKSLAGSSGKREADTKEVSLYDFQIDKLTVTPYYNGTENEVVRKQILEYMKYRAPKEIAQGVWEKMKAFKDAGKMSEAYKRKTQVDRLAGKASKIQTALKAKIDGDAVSGNVPGINAFNAGGSREALVDRFASMAMEYRGLMLNADKAGQEELNERLERAMQIKSMLDNIGNEIRTRHTAAFILPNEEAIKDLQEIIRLGRQILDGTRDLKGFMDNNLPEEEAAPQITRDFKSALQDDLERLTGLMPGEEEGEKLVEGLFQNSRYLQDALVKFDTIRNRINSVSAGDGLSLEYIVKTLNEGLREYNKFDYSYEYAQKVSGLHDPRDKIRDGAKEEMGTVDGEDITFEGAGINPALLPSARKYENGSLPGGEPEQSKNAGVDFYDMKEEIEFQENEAGFSEKAFGFISSAGEALAGSLTDVRDEIYIGEYIVHTFHSAVSSLAKLPDTAAQQQMEKEVAEERQRLFDCEVEYILHGNSSQAANKLMTKGQLLLIRFCLNTLHVYTDPQKKALAQSTAAAVSGWWSAGLSIPVVSNMIMCSWGMGEALLDLDLLMKGEPVPLYKSKGDWQLDIGLGKAAESSPQEGSLSFSYNDYLRLFLLFKDPDEKMSRIEDLIEVNVGKAKEDFKMGTSNTWLRMEAEVSMNYLFMTGAFMPGDLRTPDGRHKFRMVIYEGF